MSRGPFGVRPRSGDEAVATIERLLNTIADQRERITALETRIAEQRAKITALRAQVAAFTERLGQSFQNSSRPPSTDPPSAPGAGLGPTPGRPAGPRGPGPGAGARGRGRCGGAGEGTRGWRWSGAGTVGARFPADGFDQGFPFDVPMLDLFDRCREAARATDAFLRTPPRDAQVRPACVRFRHVIQPVDSAVPFEQHARRLRARRALFARLRDTLRLDPTPTAPSSSTTAPVNAERLRQIRLAVRKLAADLRRQRPQRGPAQDMRAAIDLVLVHLQRHGHALWGHELRLPGGSTRLVDRTNNVPESFSHTLKHGEPRRSGRKVLTQDLEQLPPGAALAMNLACPDYEQILCGSLDQLPTAFAEIDAHGQGAVRRRCGDAVETDEVVSSSLPTVDRTLVRADEMFRRIRSAATSRAPHRSPDPVRANPRLTP